ncbi:MAG: hypothetical protein JWM50_2598 [Microbacteriaceae bacterium]|jgi:hypothetical protein|nr:hypothetical protein [Microbacteriaceae bacterium]
MGTPVSHGWHSHTVTPERWIELKSQYSLRCSAQLAQTAQRRGAALRLRALEAERANTGDPFCAVPGIR